MQLEAEFEHRIGMVSMDAKTMWKYAPQAARMSGLSESDSSEKTVIMPCWKIGCGVGKTLLALGSKRPSPGLGDTDEDIGRTGYFPDSEIVLNIAGGVL